MMKWTTRDSDEYSEVEQRLSAFLKHEPIPNISQEERMEVKKIVLSYYLERETIWNWTFWYVTFSCISIDSAFLWMLFAFVLGSCPMLSLLVSASAIEPIALMSAVAPIPMFAFLLREIQYHDCNLIQIEKTCKYQSAQIYFARLWVGMIFNALSVLLVGMISFHSYPYFIQLYFCSFIAMFLIGALALLILSCTESALPLSVMLFAWVLTASFVLSYPTCVTAVLKIGFKLLVCFTVFSFGIFMFAANKTTKKLYA